MYTVKRVGGKLRQTDWDDAVPKYQGDGTLFWQIELIRQVPTMKMINKKDHGDEHHFCMTLMEKTIGRIGILNSYLNYDQFFCQCIPGSQVDQNMKEERWTGKGKFVTSILFLERKKKHPQ
jgi:hypothetical protein